jgi:hypothetical protein
VHHASVAGDHGSGPLKQGPRGLKSEQASRARHPALASGGESGTKRCIIRPAHDHQREAIPQDFFNEYAPMLDRPAFGGVCGARCDRHDIGFRVEPG